MTRRLLLLACCLCLLAGVAAAEAIPCDRDGDGTLASAELAAAILDSLDGRCMGGTVEAPSPTDLQDAAFIYTHWDGRALTITDSSGRTTTVFRPLRRIVVFNGNIFSTLRSIGIEPDRIVAVSSSVFKDPAFYPQYQGKANAGGIYSPSSSSVNYEEAALTHPDAAILNAYYPDASAETEKKFGSIVPGVRFFTFYGFMPSACTDEARTLGLLLGKEEEAARYLAFRGSVLDTVAEVVEKIPAEDRVSIYMETQWGAAGGRDSYHEKIELAGGRNIFADSPVLSLTVDPEEVIVRNPDVIIKYQSNCYSDDDWSSTFETAHQSIVNRPAWDQITAVRDGRVHIISNKLLAGSDYFIGIAYMAKWFYPDLFPDLDPRAIHQQYLREFLRIDYDLDKHAAFVYPA